MVTTDADTICDHLGDRPGLCIMASKNQPFALGTKQVSAGKIENPGGNLGFRVATYSCECGGNTTQTGRNPPTGAKDMALLCLS